jgi:hypothetical protein
VHYLSAAPRIIRVLYSTRVVSAPELRDYAPSSHDNNNHSTTGRP